MKETLLDRSVRNFKAAKHNSLAIDSDEFFINATGYFLQQAIELYLKHHIEINGKAYSKTHNIGDLLYEVPDNSISENVFELIDTYADTLTSWESRTRYVKNFFLERKRVLNIMNKLESTIPEFSSGNTLNTTSFFN